MSGKGNLRREWLTTSCVVFFSILVNVVGGVIARYYSLPAWLDSFGTVFAAYSLGPMCGAIVGCSGNVILSFWHESSFVYGITSILIGLSIGIVARKKYFDTLFHAMSVAGLVTIVSMVISSTLNMLVYNGATGNKWGDGVREYLIEKGLPLVLASLIGQLYIDFADKLITVVGMFLLIKLGRRIRSKLENEKKPSGNSAKTTAAAALLAVAIVTGASWNAFEAAAQNTDAAGTPDTAQIENKDNDDVSKSSYIRTVYNADNGLPCGHANDVVQTNDGILWVGSYSGLYRYNGSAFRFMSEYKAVKNVNCLFVDDEGRLWIGTNDDGVVVAINEKISDMLGTSQGLPSDSVRCITQNSDGDYYIGTSESAVFARLENGISIISEIEELQYMKSADSDSKGSTAAVTAAGRLYILREGKTVYEITEKDVLYTCCTFSEDGTLYAGTANGQVFVYSIGENSAKKERLTECEALSGINSIYIQGSDSLWVVADNGIGIIGSDNKFFHIETEGFSYSLERMTIDYQGNVWVASSRMGLMQLSPSPIADIFGDYGVEASVVNTTALKDDFIYIGTDNGLIILDSVKKSQIKNELTDYLAEARVRCIERDREGNLWICSYGKGLTELKKTGEIISYDSDDLDIGARVRVCMQMSDGTIAVSGDNGLYFIKDEKLQRSMLYGEELGAAKVLTLLELPDGRLFAGTDGNGITVIKDGKVTGEYTRKDGLSSGVILRMVKDVEEDCLFIATGNGLCYMKGDSIRELSSFPYSNNFDIVLDDDGDMFVLGSAGVYVVNRSSAVADKCIKYVLLNSRSGLRSSLTANAWNAVDDDKNIYLSTDRGVFTVNMDSYRSTRRFYRMTVSKMLLDGQSVPARRGVTLHIDKDVNTIELVPEIINYMLDNPNISYRLDGVDAEWKTVPQNELSHIIYTNLPSGDYVFRLAVLDPETGKTLEENAYSFVKERAIYENSWFILYMVCVGGIFIGWLTWFVTRTQIQRTMELQQTKLSLALQQVQMGNETILAIAKTVDAKDVRTSQHSQRVSEYSVKIAEKYGFDSDELENLRKSALLHDIGKIGIPDAILNKPARLTDEEYAIMKTHVTRGAEILKDFTLIEHAVDGARYHHERFDGRGYPDGLSGTSIPLYGRIIAIADAFDAMTANRVYRQKQDFSYVMNELHKGRGTQFDPDLLDIFLKLIDDGEIDIESLYKDENKNDESAGDEKNGK